MIEVTDYLQRTYSAWLGKIIGVRLGSHVEGWTYQKIKDEYGELTKYPIDYNDYAADDDINGPLFFARALMDYEDPSEKEMGETWLNYIADNHGFFWWGGYGISTENTAFNNLTYGLEAPESGSFEQNGAACAEQIGGQIFSDCWGYIFPDNPEKAALYAKRMSRVSHDGEAVLGGMFIAACISAAYTANSIKAAINRAWEVIPSGSKIYALYKDVEKFYHNDKDKNWRSCMAFLIENYGYDKYPGFCHIIPNIGVIFLSLLYGEENFTKTLTICNMCGWDTDCNAGNVGSIMGAFVGKNNIDDYWIKPIKDLVISSSAIGSLNIDSISRSAQMFCEIGLKKMGKKLPENWNYLNTADSYIQNFNFVKSTGCVRVNLEESKYKLINTDEKVINGSRSLNIISKEKELEVFIKTYYIPEDLYDSRYDPAFTPIIYSGQTVNFTLCNKSNKELKVIIFVEDYNNSQRYISKEFLVGEGWQDIEYTIPIKQDSLIRKVGLKVQSETEPINFYINKYQFCGKCKFNINFQKESKVIYPFMKGHIHIENSQFTFSKGFWEYEKDYFSGSCTDYGQAITGPYNSKNYKTSCELMPLKGENHYFSFRVQGLAKSYAIGFMGQNQIALLKRNKVYEVLKIVDFDWNYNTWYKFNIKVKNESITIVVDDKMKLLLKDLDKPYLYGQIGFSIEDNSHCHYRNLEFEEI